GEMPGLNNSPEWNLEQKELREKIEEAISSLPIAYRAVITLRHIEFLSYEEISRTLDLPPGTVRTHLYRAREALRERLKGEDIGRM
ncbi:sigma-70 family RNA polymerase sigma factor, partial [bacterium]|nr:sigma-70 family RNA polymerase sigma factor [bacterium]